MGGPRYPRTVRWRRSSDASSPTAQSWTDSVEAVALALVEGGQVASVLEALGADPATERLATFAEAEAQQDYATGSYAVQVERVGDWTLVVEPNGYLSSLPDRVVALSREGRVVSVYWNVNAQMRFQYAVGGAMVRSFDPLLPGLGPEGEPLPEEAGLPFGVGGEDSRVAAVTLAERLTGASIELTGRPRRTWTARPG